MKALRLLTGSLLFVFLAPVVFAAGEQLVVGLPTEFVLGEENRVTIEVQDADGQPVEADSLAVSYSPNDGVFDEVLYNCNDSEGLDNCMANNRGVPGIFEAVFDLVDSPVTMTIDYQGIGKQVVMKAGKVEGAVGTEETVGAVEAEEGEVAAPTAPAPAPVSAPVVSPAAVNVGPTPSLWIVLLPLFLMSAVVTYFVVKTTK